MLQSILLLAAAAASLASAPARPPVNTAGEVPEFKALKWYNTPPLTLEDLKGKAVLLQVFRTW